MDIQLDCQDYQKEINMTPVRDDVWYCQICKGETAKRDENTETKHVSYRHCPICNMLTRHATIISDRPTSKLGMDLL
jgi:hypothetical protein